MGFIFYTSSLPGSEIPSLFPYEDVVYHFFIYLMLGYFFSRALKNTCLHVACAKIILFATLFGLLYGLTDEFHQAFVPNRSVSGFDILMDTVGAFVGSVL